MLGGAPLEVAYSRNSQQQNNYRVINSDMKRKNQRSNKYFNEDMSLKSTNKYSNVSVPIPMNYEQETHQPYQQVENVKPNMNNNQQLIKQVEEKLNTPKKEHFGTINMDNFKSSGEFDCQKMLDHCAKCEKCRNYLMKKLKVSPQSSQDKEREDILNLVIYAMTGIFILFLLDAFMSLGKLLRK